MMPTHEEEPTFWRDWATLLPQQRRMFIDAIAKLVSDMKSGVPYPYRKGLRIRGVEGHPGLYEMTWQMPDGRATFSYGTSPHTGDVHIVWRRVGTHDIFKQP
jgi:hypothetical protein